MKIKLEKDDEQIRKDSITDNGRMVGNLHLRSMSAADISFFERAGITHDIERHGEKIELGNFYKVHAAAYILCTDPQRISRQLFDLREFTAIVDDWVRESAIKMDDFKNLSEAILDLRQEWYSAMTESKGSSSGN
jgi:hypothetical protein